MSKYRLVLNQKLYDRFFLAHPSMYCIHMYAFSCSVCQFNLLKRLCVRSCIQTYILTYMQINPQNKFFDMLFRYFVCMYALFCCYSIMFYRKLLMNPFLYIKKKPFILYMELIFFIIVIFFCFCFRSFFFSLLYIQT